MFLINLFFVTMILTSDFLLPVLYAGDIYTKICGCYNEIKMSIIFEFIFVHHLFYCLAATPYMFYVCVCDPLFSLCLVLLKFGRILMKLGRMNE